ncbi:Uncharacterized protein APZ42_027494 [Daphnia magna]|nr:Uncharacterized protein APZ42_027494 [Daphnia magna]
MEHSSTRINKQSSLMKYLDVKTEIPSCQQIDCACAANELLLHILNLLSTSEMLAECRRSVGIGTDVSRH